MYFVRTHHGIKLKVISLLRALTIEAVSFFYFNSPFGGWGDKKYKKI